MQIDFLKFLPRRNEEGILTIGLFDFLLENDFNRLSMR